MYKCLCVYACVICVCVCTSYLYSSGSHITKCWIVANMCECLSQTVQTLTPTPGNPFINMPPYPAWAWMLVLGHPSIWLLSLFYSASNGQTGLSHLLAWMTSFPCLAPDFLHKSVFYLYISCYLDLGFYSA